MAQPTLNPARIVVSAEPAEEPVSVAELKLHLHLDGTDEDDRLEELLETARRLLEGITGRCFVRQTLIAYFDQWPTVGSYLGAAQAREIELPRAPLVSVSAVKYLDEDEAEHTLAAGDYSVEPGLSQNWLGRVRLKPAASIPTLGEYLGALRVTFIAGAADAASVAPEIKSAIKQLAGHLHTNPVPVNTGNIVNEVPMTLQFLIQHLTVGSLR